MGVRGPREKGPLDLLDWVSRSWAEGHRDGQGQVGRDRMEAPSSIQRLLILSKPGRALITDLFVTLSCYPSLALSLMLTVFIPQPQLRPQPHICLLKSFCSDHVCRLSKHDPGDDISNLVYKQLQIRPREKETLTGARRVCKKNNAFGLGAWWSIPMPVGTSSTMVPPQVLRFGHTLTCFVFFSPRRWKCANLKPRAHSFF